MAEKIVITAEQVISQKGGFVSYADEHGTLKKVKADTVTIQGAEAAGAAPAPARAPSQEAPFPVDMPEEPGPVPIQPPLEPPPAPKSPRPKKGTKEKEPEVATKAKAKPAGKKKAVKAVAGVRTIGGKAVDLSRYQKGKAPGGGTSYNNGDAVAKKLEGKDLNEVYDIVAKALKEPVAALKAKYKNLNVGMQRMNLGNRLRKASK